MKISITFSLYCYVCISIYFVCCAGSTILQAQQNVDREHYESLKSYNQKISEILQTIKNIHKNIEENSFFLESHEQNNQSYQRDCPKEILVVLIEMYEKIIEATVTYYVMIHTPTQYNVHNIVARIIADGIVKIIAIGGKECVFFLYNKQMTWQQKAWYGAIIIAGIGMIKLGIDQIPKLEKSQDSPFGYYHRPQIQSGESSYVEGKFDNYK